MTTPMMACGHSANAKITATGAPCCVICAGDPRSEQVVPMEAFGMQGRLARCEYYGKSQGEYAYKNEGPCKGGACMCERPSSPNLAFFKHTPEKPQDEYYCGCWGWD
jgi:hypothetical protein